MNELSQRKKEGSLTKSPSTDLLGDLKCSLIIAEYACSQWRDSKRNESGC